MSYTIDRDRYLCFQYYDDNGKKVRILVARVDGGDLIMKDENLPRVEDFHLKAIYEHESKLELLRSGKSPLGYVFDESSYMTWKRQRTTAGRTDDKTINTGTILIMPRHQKNAHKVKSANSKLKPSSVSVHHRGQYDRYDSFIPVSYEEKLAKIHKISQLLHKKGEENVG